MGFWNFIKSALSFGSKMFGGFFRFSLFATFFIILLVYFLSVSIQQHDIGIAIKGLGDKFLNNLVELNDLSLKAKDSTKDLGSSSGFFKNLWELVIYYSSFYFLLYTIYIEIKILGLPAKIYNASETALHLIAGIILFFIFQMFYIMYNGKGDINFPFYAIWTFITSIPDILQPIFVIVK